MANRLKIRRGTGSPGGVFYEGEPIYDKTGKVLYVGDNGAAGSGAGISIASAGTHATVLEMLTKAAYSSAGVIKFRENSDNGNHFVGLAASATIPASITFTLPNVDGTAGQALKTSGNGVLSFGDVAASGISSVQNDSNPVLGGDLNLNNKIIVGTGITINGSSGIITATKFVKTGGTSAQYLMADGSISSGGGGTAGSISLTDESSDTTCFPVFATAATGDLALKTGSNITFNSANGTLTATSFSGSGAGVTGVNAATLDSVYSTSFLRSDAADIKTSGNLTLSDSVVLELGDSADVNIVSIGDTIRQYSSSGKTWEYWNRGGKIKFGYGGASYGNDRLVIDTNAAVELYYGDTSSSTKTLETTGAGVTVFGTTETQQLNVSGVSTLTGQVSFGNTVTFGDADRIIMGAGNDLQIYHNGTNNIIDTLTGDLIIKTNDSGDLTGDDIIIRAADDAEIQVSGGTTAIYATGGGSVNIKHNGATKLETTASGASITGDLVVSGNLNVTGTSVTFSVETTKVEDRLMELGLVDGDAPSSATTWDLGVLFNYHDGAPKKSGIIWLDNTHIAAVGVATETVGTGNNKPQVNISSYAPFVSSALHIGGIGAGTTVINSSKEAVNLIFDGGSY